MPAALARDSKQTRTALEILLASRLRGLGGCFEGFDFFAFMEPSMSFGLQTQNHSNMNSERDVAAGSAAVL